MNLYSHFFVFLSSPCMNSFIIHLLTFLNWLSRKLLILLFNRKWRTVCTIYPYIILESLRLHSALFFMFLVRFNRWVKSKVLCMHTHCLHAQSQVYTCQAHMNTCMHRCMHSWLHAHTYPSPPSTHPLPPTHTHTNPHALPPTHMYAGDTWS